MDEIKNQIQFSKLLAGKVLGSLTEEQKRKLSQWEQQSDNKKLADNILNAQSFTDWKQKLNDLNTEEEWKSFLERMGTATINRGKVIRLKAIKLVASVAAVFLIGFALFSLYETIQNSKFQPIEASSIEPGSSNAELVLSTGEVINLEDTLKDKINESNVALENIKGVLQYKDSINDKLVDAKTNTLRVPRGGEYQLVLADGTKVWLNSDTELTYPVSFVGKERRVTLKGEAYFEVTPNKEVPFIVTTGNQDVEVLGTKFNISSYVTDTNIITTLVEGKVKVFDRKSDATRYLLPNEQSVLNKNTDNIKKQKVDVYPYIAWKEGRFVFSNVPLDQFLNKIARWYDVDVVFEDDSLKNIKFSGDLPRYSNMTGILKIIEAEMSVHIKIEDNKKVYVFK